MEYKQGVVTRIDGKVCIIDYNGEAFRAYIRHKIKGADPKNSRPICVGDYIKFTNEEHSVVIHEVEKRKSKLSRQAVSSVKKEQVVVSNVDQLLIVTSAQSPPFHPGIIDRFLVASLKGELDPIICINKVDLVPKTRELEKISEAAIVYRELNYPVVLSSVKNKEGIEEIASLLKGKSTVVGGHSGVGKSSLLSAIDPSIKLSTNKISKKSNRGRHTTTSVNLLPLSDGCGYVVDTPGIREFSLWNTEVEEVAYFFPEIYEHSGGCRYSNCTHTHEPSCMVKEAVATGEIADFRYNSYCNILHSIKNPSLSSRPEAFY